MLGTGVRTAATYRLPYPTVACLSDENQGNDPTIIFAWVFRLIVLGLNQMYIVFSLTRITIPLIV